MASQDSPSSHLAQSWLHRPIPREAVLASCLAIPLSLLLLQPGVSGDPWLLASFLQVCSVACYALILVKIFLPRQPPQAPEAAPAAYRSRGVLWAWLTAALAYAPIFLLSFDCDDFVHLDTVHQPFRASLLPQFTHGQFNGITYIFYRPLGFSSLFLDYRLWHRWAPGYHLVNLALHLVTVAGVYFLCRQLALRPRACASAAAFFALLPINVQAVTWIGCRFDQLAAALGVWSLVAAAAYRRSERLRHYATALLLFALAALSKESAYSVAVLWFALEMVPIAGDRKEASRTRRLATMLGYLLLPLLLWTMRYLILGGIGGYPSRKYGGPIVSHFGGASLAGILWRAPAETLFGYNWLMPARWPLLLSAAVFAALVLTLCLFARMNRSSRRVAAFCLLWIPVSVLPAHFYFVRLDPSLFFARALYFASIGLAILLGMLAGEGFDDARHWRTWTLALVLLMAFGQQHNLSAWRKASCITRHFLADLRRAYPNPPAGATFYIRDAPSIVDGVPLFTVGLNSAVRFDYGWRSDVHAAPAESQRHRKPANATHLYFKFPKDCMR